MLEFLQSPTFRRILAALIGIVLPLINKRLGLEIPTEQVVSAMALLSLYIGQSVVNSMHQRGSEAAVTIATTKADGAVDAAAAAPANVVAVVPSPK